MTQEDKELLLKDICARMPYGVVIHFDEKTEQDDERLYGMRENGGKFLINDAFYIEEIKPYLFPLSSMTDEQKKELSKLGVSYGEYALHDDTRGLGIYVDEAYILFEFCYKHHIDFLDLIEKGLAIDATGLNIY